MPYAAMSIFQPFSSHVKGRSCSHLPRRAFTACEKVSGLHSSARKLSGRDAAHMKTGIAFAQRDSQHTGSSGKREDRQQKRDYDSDDERNVSWLGPACGVDDLKIWRILHGPNAELSYANTGHHRSRSSPQNPPERGSSGSSRKNRG